MSSKASADFLAFEVARLNLESALADNGSYVNTVAKGDATIVSKSGYPSYQTGAGPIILRPGRRPASSY